MKNGIRREEETNSVQIKGGTGLKKPEEAMGGKMKDHHLMYNAHVFARLRSVKGAG
jgi:hypothetical protein